LVQIERYWREPPEPPLVLIEAPPELPPEVPTLPPTLVVDPVVVARDPVETLVPVLVEVTPRLSTATPPERCTLVRRTDTLEGSSTM
jgi:hypothetical protein